MSQLGERLRMARESQGISLSQAAVETRILQRYLVALEDGDFQHLPGDVYARGFIRNYASYLGIPAEELIELYRRERGTTDPIRVVPATSSPRIRGFVVPSFFGVFFVVLALIGISYLILNATNQIGESARTQVAGIPTAAPTPEPLPTSPPDATSVPVIAAEPTAAPSQTPLAVAGAAPNAPPSPTPEAPIVFEVRIDPGDNPGSWLSIETDGRRVLQKILKPGEAWSGTAQRKLFIKAGNAWVVSVIVNGQLQPRLSTTPNEVQTFSWPPP
jgi:cytoskeletal protein RodZ